MLQRNELERAVRIHRDVYAFIDWLRRARFRVPLRFDEQHRAMNEFDAAVRWMMRNKDQIAADVFPRAEHVEAFANMLVSFGLTSRGGTASDRRQMGWRGPGLPWAPDGIAVKCTCRFCSEMVWQLGCRSWTRPVAEAKRGARLLKLAALREMVGSLQVPLVEGDLEPLAAERGEFDRCLAAVAFARELVRRCSFRETRLAYVHLARGLLLLWKQVARDEHGRVPKKFRVKVDHVLSCEKQVADRLRELVDRAMG